MAKLTKAQLQARLRQLGVSFSQSDSAVTLQAILDNAESKQEQQQQPIEKQQQQQEYANPISLALSQVSLSETAKLQLLQLDTEQLFYWDNDSFIKVTLTDLVRAIVCSGIQFDLDVKSLGKLLSNIAKDGCLLQPIQIAYNSQGELIIVSGRNRTASLLLIEMLKKSQDPSFNLTVPCQILKYPNDSLLYRAVVGANDSRRMSTTEQSLTEVSAVLPNVSLDAIFSVANNLTEKQLKCALATLVRQKLAELNGNSVTEFGYSLGLKSAKDSKFLLDLLTASLPSLKQLQNGKGKNATIQYSRLESVVNKLTSISNLTGNDKAITQTLAKCPSDVIDTLAKYQRPIQAILMLKASGIDRLARSISKPEEGSYSLKSILLSLCDNWNKLDSYLDNESNAKPVSTKSEGVDLVNLLEQMEVDLQDL